MKADRFLFEFSSTTLGNPDVFNGAAIVMFVDLLGFSAETLSEWSTGSPLAALTSINEEIRALSKLKDFPHKRGFRQHIYRPYATTISDSVIVAFALPSKPGPYEYWVGLKVMSAALSIIWDATTKLGYTLRGGLDLGQAAWNEHIFTGPALIHSYGLETRSARWSRVVVGSGLVQHMKGFAEGFMRENSEFLTVSEDGMIELPYVKYLDTSPTKEEFQQRIETIMRKNERFSDKYRPLLRSLSSSDEKVCTPAAMEIAMEKYRIYR